MKRTITGAIIVVVMLAGGYGLMSLLSSMKKEPAKRPSVEFKMNVQTGKVEYKDNEFEIYAQGRVLSNQLIDLTSEVQGKILAGNVALKKGERFRKGDLLARVYSTDIRYNLQAHKSRFLNVLAGILPDLKIDFPEAYVQWNEFFNNIDLQKSIPQLPEIKEEKEKIFLASRNILSEYYSIKSEEIRLAKYAIYAPFNGSFTDVYMETGSVANPGSKLAKMIHTDHLEIEVPVHVDDAVWLNKGEEVFIYNDLRNKQWKGKLVRISNFVNTNTQSISAFIKIDKKDSKSFYQGQYYTVSFINKIATNTMSLPRSAVLNHNEIFTVVNGKLKKEQIKVERINATNLFFSGLEEGTELVTQAMVNARENTKVNVIQSSIK